MSPNTTHTRMEKLLLEAARRFNSTLEYEELIQEVLLIVAAAVQAEAALVFRVDHSRSDMKIRFMNCPACKIDVFYQEFGQGVVGKVAEYKEPVIVNKCEDISDVEKEIGEKAGVTIKSLISIPLIGKGQMIGVIEAFNREDGPFTETDLDVLTGLANQIAVAIDNAYLYRKVRQEALEKHLLFEIGMKLSSTLELDKLLEEILSSLRKVIDYSAGGVFLIEPDKKEIGSIFTIGYAEESAGKLQLKIGQGLIGQVAKTGKPVVVSDVSANKQYVNVHAQTKSEIVVPILLDGNTIGVLTLESNNLNAYDKNSVELLSAFATQAAISIERTRLHQKIIAAQKIENQLSITREIQRSFLPDSDPVIDGYDIAGKNIPSEQVGGDYYDFIEIMGSQLGVAVGDVSGKGIPAALIMASFRSSLIAEIRNNYSISEICSKVNSLLYESIGSGNFVTAVYGVLDSEKHIFTYANCGHNQPILLKQNGTIEHLKEGGQVLGISPGVEYRQGQVELKPGELIVLYTDGVTEVFDEKGREFGEAGLLAALKEHSQKSSAEMLKNIVDNVREYAASEHIFDDLTMVILKRTA
ncbi:MAG: SpoIIE family protein phosphatase [candidate division Zixibacteria bacterium]|nr:SpoIIE family protein phosphatase [candidate division Zixibacteria bacterium]